MNDRKPDANEGEGNRTAAREYNKATRDFIAEGKVAPAAEKAREDLEGPDAEALREAEREGRSRAKS
jgi:hypothetical protein